MARKIDQEVRELVEGSLGRAKSILGSHREQLENLVKVLLEKETLERHEVEAVLRLGYLPEASQGKDESSATDGGAVADGASRDEGVAPGLVGPPVPDPSVS